MKPKIKATKTTINVNEAYEGETIEEKIRRIVNNKEPIKDGAPLIYTERKKGVEPEYNIRSDRFEIALEAMDKITSSQKARREAKMTLGDKAIEGMIKEDVSEAKTIGDTKQD